MKAKQLHHLTTIYTSSFIVSCNIKYFNYQYHPMIRYPMIFEYSICLKENYWSYDTLRYDIRSKFLIVDSTLVLTLDTTFLFGFWKRLHNVLIQNSNSKFLIFYLKQELTQNYKINMPNINRFTPKFRSYFNHDRNNCVFIEKLLIN